MTRAGAGYSGLVDPHTHLVFAGSRENEFAMRLQGATYMEIMNAGGGIHATTAATQQASHEQLARESKRRLDQFLQHGVTTLEAKSGYGLTLEHELNSWKWPMSWIVAIPSTSSLHLWELTRFQLHIRTVLMILSIG